MANAVTEISISNHTNITPLRVSLSDNPNDPPGTFFMRQGTSYIRTTADDLDEINTALERLYSGE